MLSLWLDTRLMKKVKLYRPIALFIDVSLLTIDDQDSTRSGNIRVLDTKTTFITSCSDTPFFTIGEHPLEVTWCT